MNFIKVFSLLLLLWCSYIYASSYEAEDSSLVEFLDNQKQLKKQTPEFPLVIYWDDYLFKYPVDEIKLEFKNSNRHLPIIIYPTQRQEVEITLLVTKILNLNLMTFSNKHNEIMHAIVNPFEADMIGRRYYIRANRIIKPKAPSRCHLGSCLNFLF